MTCMSHQIHWSLENPRHSRLFELPVLAPLLSGPKVYQVDIDFCRFGEKFKKPTRIFTSVAALTKLHRLCNHRKHAVVLRGSETVSDNGKRRSAPRTQAAGVYPYPLADHWAQALVGFLGKQGRDSELLNLQWINELKQCVPSRPAPSQTASSTAPLLAHVEALGEAKKFVVFGQHSCQEADQRKAELLRTWPKDKHHVFPGCAGPQILASASTTAGATGQGPDAGEI